MAHKPSNTKEKIETGKRANPATQQWAESGIGKEQSVLGPPSSEANYFLSTINFSFNSGSLKSS